MLNIHDDHRRLACFWTSTNLLYVTCHAYREHAPSGWAMQWVWSCYETSSTSLTWRSAVLKIYYWKIQHSRKAWNPFRNLKEKSVQFGVRCLKSSCVQACLQAWQGSEVPTVNGCVETAYAVWLWGFSKSLQERSQWPAAMCKERGERPHYSCQLSLCLSGKS